MTENGTKNGNGKWIQILVFILAGCQTLCAIIYFNILNEQNRENRERKEDVFAIHQKFEKYLQIDAWDRFSVEYRANTKTRLDTMDAQIKQNTIDIVSIREGSKK